MRNSSFKKAGLLALVIVIAAVTCWELYVRSKGFERSFDDEGPLWSDKRAMVYMPADKATVFIGSSRIKFDLDISTWESLTGDRAIQLACVGSSPLPVLQNLADDTRFKGKLVVDVTEPLYFSTSKNNTESPEKNIKYYKDQTIAQWISFNINHLLESQLALLDKDRLSLNAMLAKLHIPNRKGVFEFPIFPAEFGRVKYNRQEYMTDHFAQDTTQQVIVRGIWDFFRSMSKDPPASGAILDSMLELTKKCVDKIVARGGKVIFVRTPSSGSLLSGEKKGFPRELFWDKLLAYTKCNGIHFEDYPSLAHFECPEFSHLSQKDAVIFTKEFTRILKEEKEWKFAK